MFLILANKAAGHTQVGYLYQPRKGNRNLPLECSVLFFFNCGLVREAKSND